jgi:hypothetical protein
LNVCNIFVAEEGRETIATGAKFTVSYNLLAQLTSPTSERLAITEIKII